MAKLSFDFFNRNYTQRIDKVVAAVAEIKAGTIVSLVANTVTALDNATVANTIQNLYLLAEDFKIGDVYFVGYPIREDDWIAGVYKGKDFTIAPGLDVLLHENYIIPIADKSGSGTVAFELVKVGPLKVVGAADLTVVTGGAALIKGDKFKLDGDSKTAKDAAGPFVAAAAYTSGTTASVELYQAHCAIKVL